MFTVQVKEKISSHRWFHIARDHACSWDPRADVAGYFSFRASEHDGAPRVIRHSREGFAV